MSKVAKSVKKGLKSIDPTTTKGLINIATMGTGGAFIDGALGGGVSKKINEALEGPKDPGATESEKVAADIAKKEYNFARQLDYVKDEYANRVEQLGTQQMQNAVTGRANIDAQTQANDLSQQAQIGLAQAGIDPSSGRAATTMTAAQDAAGNAAGRAQGEAAFALDSAHLEGQNNRIAMAMGEKTKAVAGLQDIAAGANAKAIDEARNKFNNKAAVGAAIGTGVGMAGQHYIGNTGGPGANKSELYSGPSTYTTGGNK